MERMLLTSSIKNATKLPEENHNIQSVNHPLSEQPPLFSERIVSDNERQSLANRQQKSFHR
jgi:hypothetical protein